MVFGEWDMDTALEVAKEEGMEEGMEKGIRLTAGNLKRSGMPPEKISEYTGLSLDTINSL
ncbi:MAG: hypothetical protein Ta2G_16760 [Termitinemataceae bacterium]|nr:MAG: hypothetical protein Ta2G_16760 [Termitinemataceae bacterium]